MRVLEKKEKIFKKNIPTALIDDLEKNFKNL